MRQEDRVGEPFLGESFTAGNSNPRADESDDQVQVLERQLAEAEEALQAVISGQVDAVVEPGSAAPILLRQAQEALRASENRYHRLVTRMSAIVFELDPGGTILSVNEAAMRVTGYSPDELIGKNWWEIFFPSDQRGQVSLLLDRLQSGDVTNYELGLVVKDGARITLELNSANYYNEQGSLEKIVGFGVDITQRKRAEEQVLRSQQQLAHAQQVAHLGSWIWDLPSNTITWSEELYRIYGVSPQDFNPTLEGSLDRVHPDDREYTRQVIDRAAQDLKPFNYIHRIIRPDSSVRFLQVRGEVVAGREGNPLRMVGTAHDITEQKELEAELLNNLNELQVAEEELKAKNEELALSREKIIAERQRYQDLFEFAPDGYLVTDAQGVIKEANRAATYLLGVDLKFVIGKVLSLFISEDQRRSFRNTLIRFNKGESARGWETRLLPRNGPPIPVAAIAAPVYDDSGQTIALRWLLHDITGIKQAEAALREQKNILQSIITSMGEAVLVSDKNGKFILHNPAAEKLLGITENVTDPGQWAAALGVYLPDEETPCPIEELPFVRALRGEQVNSDELCLRPTGSSEPVWVLSTARPLLDEGGQLAGAVVVFRDITERKRAEENLRQSGELYRLVVENAKEYAIFTLDPNGYVTSWNSGAENIKGYSAEEILGKHFSLFYPPEQVASDRPRKILNEALEQGRFEIEDWRIRKGGSRFWASIVITPLWDDRGQLLGFSKVVRDMTRRKQADEALRRQTEFVRLLQDIAVAANQAASVAEAMQYALDRLCQHTGWPVGHALTRETGSQDGLVSMQLWHLDQPERFPDFRQVSEETHFAPGLGLPGKVLSSGKPIWVRDLREETDFIRNESVELRGLKMGVAFPVLAKDRIVGVLEFFSDQILEPDSALLEVMAHIGTQLGRVVERKQSEQALLQSEARFRTIFEGAAMGIVMIDLQGHLLACNRAIGKILGYDSSELRRTALGRIDHPANVVSYRSDGSRNGDKFFDELRLGRRDFYRLERLYTCKDGSQVWGRLSVSLVRNAEGQPQFAIGMLEDISERKQMEADLAELKRRQMEGRELERLHLAQELHDGPVQDLYGLSFHLKAFQDHLPSDQDDPQAMHEMQDNLQHVVRTLRSICGELRPPALAPFGLEKAIRSHADEFQEAHPELGIALDLMPDRQTLSEPVRLALFRIYQQALNNVVRHAHASNVIIRLVLDENQVRLEIEDDGQGFELPSRWVSLAREGHLGLVGAVERAEAIGGILNVESNSGRGTRVRVIVPRAPTPPTSPTPPS